MAARLIDQIGPVALAEITEAAGVYAPGQMRRHPSSALGASESSLIAMAAGYAAIANGGIRVTPHTHVMIESDGALLIPEQPREVPVMTQETAELLSSMLYGVTVRGTAARAFGPNPPIAGKTGTTQSHRDAWFVGFSRDLVIAVWVGRDDNTPLPGRSTGASAATPIVARIIEAAERDGLARGFTLSAEGAWPPPLLEAGLSPGLAPEQSGALVFEPDPEARRRAMEAGGDPFKNPQDLFDQIRETPLEEVTPPEGSEQDVWGTAPEPDPWSQRPPADPFNSFSQD